jgi:hypothetical protein
LTRLDAVLREVRGALGPKSNYFDLAETKLPDSSAGLQKSSSVRINNQSNASRLLINQMLKRQGKEFSQILLGRTNK